MITAWMLYAVVVGALLGAGALALEKVLRTHGLPSRWLWAGTILLSVLFPLGHLALRSMPRPVPVVSVPETVMAVPTDLPQIPFPLEPAVVEVPPESMLRLMDRPVLVAWALSTGILVLFAAFLLLRTRRLMGRWRRGRVEGQSVLYSDEWGPAVVGFLRPQVVLPRWCQEVDDRAARFILDHELEHVRAGDLRLILTAGVLPILVPWHIPLWWQLSRLRTAVEGDCDLRVLRRNPGQMKPYVDLLLKVGAMNPGRRPIAAMLSEPYETLKRRIKIMTMPFPKRPWIRGGLLVGLGTLMVGLACGAPGPTDAANEEPDTPVEPAPSVDPSTLSAEAAQPTFTPYTVSPDIKNREEVAAALEGAYPASLKEEGVGGLVAVWFFVDEDGKVQRVQVNQSSRRRELDDAAVSIASLVEFTPALNRDKKVPVWVSLPIAFGPMGSQAAEEFEVARRAARAQEMAPFRRGPSSRAEGAGVQDPTQVGEIGGTALDATSGAPLRFTQIVVAGTGYGTLTNEEGRFLIEGVPAGDHVVGAVLMGYRREGQEARVRTGERVSVEFGLRAQAVALTPMVVPGGIDRDSAEGRDDAVSGQPPSLELEPPDVKPASQPSMLEPPPQLPGQDGAGTLWGTITEDGTGATVGGVRVSIPALEIGGISNIEGKYLMFNVQPGTHTLLIEKEGFPPVEVEVVIEAGETTVVDPVIRK